MNTPPVKYAAYLEQAGQGCDYTIGCGEKLIFLDSPGIMAAKKELIDLIEEEYDDTETRLAAAKIFQISAVWGFDMPRIYAAIEVRRVEADEKMKNDEEYMEYLRLKEKFEIEKR